MKKTFKFFMATAILAMTFAACEDVPEPYYVFDEDNTPSAVTESTGTGTVDDPFNVAAARAKCQEVGTEQSAESYYVKGIVVSGGSADAQYGNVSFYIADSQDGGDTFYCFQVLGSNGAKLPAGYTVNIGDEVVVYGPIYNYKGNTPETVGKGAAHIVTINGKATNEGGNEQPAGEAVGSKDAPKTVAEAVAAITAMADGTTSNEYWYVTGKVIRVTTNQANFEKYGNLNYLISADGTEGTTQMTVYSGDGLNGEKFSGIDALKQGDEVVVYGQLQKYVNTNTGAMTPELAKGNYLVKHTPAGNTPTPQPTGEAKGSGTAADPFNPVGAINYVVALGADVTSSDDIYVKGKISSIKYTYSSQYGTATYNISEDGTAANEFTVYSSYYFNNTSWAEGNMQIQVGDEVIVCGKVIYYQGTTPEFASKQNYLVSLNGKTSDEGGDTPDNPNPQPGNAGGTLSGNVLTVNAPDFGFAADANATTATLVDGTAVTFDKGTGSSAPKYFDGSFASVRVYANNTVTITSTKKIASVAFTTTAPNGTTKYNGSDLAYANAEDNKVTKIDDTNVTFNGQGLKTVSIVNFSEKNSGNQLRISQMVITYAE